MSFETALKFTVGSGGKDLGEEGGFSNDPADPGGATNRGVTQRTYDHFRDTINQPRQSVELITDAEVSQLYEMFYWEPSKAQIMHSPLDVCHFDASVNLGISRALKTLQQALKVTPDGIWGNETASALAAADTVETMQEYNSIRKQFYQDLAQQKPTLEKFLKGWLARCDRLSAYCETL